MMTATDRRAYYGFRAIQLGADHDDGADTDTMLRSTLRNILVECDECGWDFEEALRGAREDNEGE